MPYIGNLDADTKASYASADNYRNSVLLAANVAESFTVPTKDGVYAKYVRLKSTGDFYAQAFKDELDSDLVTNGGFATDTSWTKGTGWTIGSGTASSDASQSAESLLTQDHESIYEGQAYYVTFTVSAYTAGNVAPKIGGTAGTNRSSAATFSEVIIAGSSKAIALAADADFNGSVDNFSVVAVAKVPGDLTTGNAPALNPAGFALSDHTKVSVVSASTPIIVAEFFF